MGNCSRSLDEMASVELFLRNVLELGHTREQQEQIENLANEVISAEKQLFKNNDNTLSNPKVRVLRYATDESRRNLRFEIYKDLTQRKRLKDDDKISLHRGGALPTTPLQNDKQAYYIIGLPASGKSSISNKLSNQYGAIILDSDYAKRKFPEYKSLVAYEASLVHEESSIVVFGGQGSYSTEPSVLEYAVNKNINIVIPKIGDKKEKVIEFSQSLKNVGYNIHLILVRADRRLATKRALDRYLKTKRYIPLSLIFDEYGNNPTISFYDSLHLHYDLFSSFTMISADVLPHKIVFQSKNFPTIKLCDK